MPRRTAILIASLVLLVGAAWVSVPGVLAGGGCHTKEGSEAPIEGPATVVRMDSCRFAPDVVRVKVGTEIRFLNTDRMPHQVTGGSWTSEMLEPGQDAVVQFAVAGVHAYSCPLHPGMVGAVVVGDDVVPAAAVAPEAAEPAPAAATGAGGVDPWLAIGLGGASGLFVLAAGLVVARRRGDQPSTG